MQSEPACSASDGTALGEEGNCPVSEAEAPEADAWLWRQPRAWTGEQDNSDNTPCPFYNFVKLFEQKL